MNMRDGKKMAPTMTQDIFAYIASSHRHHQTPSSHRSSVADVVSQFLGCRLSFVGRRHDRVLCEVMFSFRFVSFSDVVFTIHVFCAFHVIRVMEINIFLHHALLVFSLMVPTYLFKSPQHHGRLKCQGFLIDHFADFWVRYSVVCMVCAIHRSLLRWLVGVF